MDPDRLRQSLPRSRRLVLARGLLPLPPCDALEMLVGLARDDDPEVAQLARGTLELWPVEDLLPALAQKECACSVLQYFSDPARPEAVLAALIDNPATPGGAVAVLARTLDEPLVGRTLDNRNRVLASPEILAAARVNPRAGAETLRVIREIEADFMGARRTDYALAPSAAPTAPPGAEAPAAAASDLHPAAAGLEPEIPPGELSLEGLPPDDEERRRAISTRLSSLPVREKIHYALFGTREIRAVLVADTNKEVARAVLRSPKLGDSEVESIAALRTVGEDILREIGGSREWTKSYNTVHNLVRNPKTPPAVSQRLMFRLRSQDLGMLMRDKSIPDAVRHNASRLVKQRSQTRTGS